MAYVFQPISPSTAAWNPFSKGIRPEEPGKPSAPSVITPIPLLVALRPLRMLERVGEHSAVVWKLE
jgi:hypothetical protein